MKPGWPWALAGTSVSLLSAQVGCAMCQQSLQKHLLEFHEVRTQRDSCFTAKEPTWVQREGKGDR